MAVSQDYGPVTVFITSNSEVDIPIESTSCGVLDGTVVWKSCSFA